SCRWQWSSKDDERQRIRIRALHSIQSRRSAVRPALIDRKDIWERLEQLSSGELPVFARILPDDVADLTVDGRLNLAKDLELVFTGIPGLNFYSRIGMFDFIGVSESAWDTLVPWAE